MQEFWRVFGRNEMLDRCCTRVVLRSKEGLNKPAGTPLLVRTAKTTLACGINVVWLSDLGKKF